MNYHEWFRAQEEKAREERAARLARERAIQEGILRLLGDTREDVLHAQCPVCEGRGTVGVVFGSRDDEATA